jgi:endonuclease/exonuclease/phosphatase family metal-dependent hydrolase
MPFRWRHALIVASSLVLSAAPRAFAQSDIVLYSSDVTVMAGGEARVSSSTGAGGQKITTNDGGWSTTSEPLASPWQYIEATISPQANTPYHVWLRLHATGESKWNDSVWVQFTDSTDPYGSGVYRIGTTSALMVNLERCSGCGVSGWGWMDRAWWLGQSPIVKFATSGARQIRIQTREDGVEIDQIVLSPATYYSSAPGSAINDSTIVPKASAPAPAPAPAPTARVFSVPGTIQAEDFEDGQYVGYYDDSGGNNGGQYRNTDVDIETSSDSGGGYNVGWMSAGEWLKYTVNVASSGSYTLQARVACSGTGGTFHVEVNGSNVTGPISVPNTGGWQNWITVSANVNLAAGQQPMKVVLDTAGPSGAVGNLNWLALAAGSTAPPPPPPSSSSTLRVMTWNIQHGFTAGNAYDPAGQVRVMADSGADIILLQEVQTWDEYQPSRYKALLEQYTGKTWTAVWAPVNGNTGTEGNMVLTSLQVVASSVFQMHATSDWTQMYANRSAARARIVVGPIALEVLSTHLDYYSTAYRTTQLLQLMDYARTLGGPRILGGDFNSSYYEWWITTVKSEYSDTWADVTGSNDGGASLPNGARIDYLFRAFDQASRVRPTGCRVIQTDRSDHWAIVADYVVQ